MKRKGIIKGINSRLILSNLERNSTPLNANDQRVFEQLNAGRARRWNRPITRHVSVKKRVYYLNEAANLVN